MKQHLRLLIFLGLITGLCCCLFGAIFLSDLQRSYDQLLAQRIGVVASDVAATVENRVNLGLPLNYLSDMQATLERSRQESVGIESVSVADEQGTVLFSTDRVVVGSTSIMPEGTEPLTLTDQDRLRMLVPMKNSFDHPIGAIVVVGARSHLDPAHLAQLGMPFLAAGVFVALGLILAYLLARLFLQDLETRTQVMIIDAEAALARALDPREIPETEGAATEDAAADRGPLSRRVTGMIRALQAAIGGVQRIDETV
ncbi:MAG TPA: hypothetical protein VL574_11335 [Stellaceae bacterium]|jgi:hypothetical protein|nr:hypothetical protein [Stellaceae bacterium]